MTSNSFSFADLIPEPLTFRDDAFGGDGTIHDVHTAEMLSVSGVVELARAEDRLRRLVAGAEPSLEDIQELERMMDQIMRLIVPGLPAERLAAIPFQFKMQLLAWWKENMPDPEELPAGEAAAGQRLIQAHSSPASSDSTASPPATS